MELTVINSKIAELRGAEGTVKTLVAELALAVAGRVHEHNDVDSANAFLLALTPINQKKAIAFLKEHTGHKVEEGILTKRLKDYVSNGVKVSPYAAAVIKYEAFVASGMNFWQWAVAKKDKIEDPITLDKAAKLAKKAREYMAEAMQAGVLDKVQAFEMLIGGVMSQDDVLNILASMTKAEDAMTKAAQESAKA